jgi:hypothetical protein
VCAAESYEQMYCCLCWWVGGCVGKEVGGLCWWVDVWVRKQTVSSSSKRTNKPVRRKENVRS